MLVQESAFCFVVRRDYGEALAIQSEDFRYLPWLLTLGRTDRNCPSAAWFLCHGFCIDSSLHNDLCQLNRSYSLLPRVVVTMTGWFGPPAFRFRGVLSEQATLSVVARIWKDTNQHFRQECGTGTTRSGLVASRVIHFPVHDPKTVTRVHRILRAEDASEQQNSREGDCC